MDIDNGWDEPRYIVLEVTWSQYIGPKMKQFVRFDTVMEMIVEDEELENVNNRLERSERTTNNEKATRITKVVAVLADGTRQHRIK
jgi:hypothetical protein